MRKMYAQSVGIPILKYSALYDIMSASLEPCLENLIKTDDKTIRNFLTHVVNPIKP